MNIYLVGFMGSGKSTIGKILSEKLNMKLVDIDEEIEKEQKKQIKDIFKEKGEQFFRNLEKEKIIEYTKKEGLIISTGGGLGADPDNMEKMKKSGKVIWLDISLEEVFKRCKNDKDRPLLNQPMEKIEKFYNKRKNIYKLSDIHIKVDNKSPEKIVEEIIENLRRN